MFASVLGCSLMTFVCYVNSKTLLRFQFSNIFYGNANIDECVRQKYRQGRWLKIRALYS